MGGNAQYRKKIATKKIQKSTEENYTPVNRNKFRNQSESSMLNYAKYQYDTRYYPKEVSPSRRSTQTQSMSLLLGNNAKPTIVSSEELARLKQEEGAIILSRSTKSVRSLKEFTDNDYTILPAGRWGEATYGEGIYFDSKDGNTGYGKCTITGVLSKNAKIVTNGQLEKMQQTGMYTTVDGKTITDNYVLSKSNTGALALALGYDAISLGDKYNDYFVLLNRSALITDGRVY